MVGRKGSIKKLDNLEAEAAMSEAARADLRGAMRRIASSVAVLSAYGTHGPAGITATSVASVSVDPPALLICVNRLTRLNDAVVESGAFRVSYLAHDQRDVAGVFGTSGAGDRFQTGAWDCNAAVGPRLSGAIADIACKLRHRLDHGTHSIFVGDVIDVSVHGGRPLLYCEGDYSELAA